MQKLVIFDWDGVIADSCPQFLELYRRTTEHFGRSFPIRTVEDFRDWYNSAWENNFTHLGFSPEEVPRLITHLSSLVDYDLIPLFAGIRETLSSLAGLYRIAIASTTHSCHIREKLAREDLESLFACIEGGEGGTSEKRAIIARVIASMGIGKESIIMVGDTEMDIRSSRAEGIRNIAVTYGWNSAEKLAASAPDHMIESHRELEPLLSGIFSP
jgi:phosphoglycolate phosphatase